MPARAVRPVPKAYIKVVAVKTLVVGSQSCSRRPLQASIAGADKRLADSVGLQKLIGLTDGFTLKKSGCSKQANAWMLVHGIME